MGPNSSVGAMFLGFFVPMAFFILTIATTALVVRAMVRRERAKETATPPTNTLPDDREVLEAGARVEYWGGNLERMSLTKNGLTFKITRPEEDE